MNQNIGRLECSICGSPNVTVDPINKIAVCNACGSRIRIRSPQYVPDPSWTATVWAAGTNESPIIKTEEEHRLRTITQEIFPHSHEEFKKLEKDINRLENRLTQIDSKVEELRVVSPKVVVIEEVPRDEAKHRVEEYFKEHKTADIETLVLNLKISVQTLVEVIDELKKEGKITAEEGNS